MGRIKEISVKQKAFADEYLQNGGNGLQAAKKAYKTKNDASAVSLASQTLTKVNVREYIADKAGDAAKMIYKMSQTAKHEPTRLNANKDILDRAGYKPIEKTMQITASMSDILNGITQRKQRGVDGLSGELAEESN